MDVRARITRLAAPSLSIPLLGLFIAVTQTGCPQGADLQNPDQYPPVTSSGGSSGSGGSSNASAGTGTAGSASQAQLITPATVGCAFDMVLGTGSTRGSCAILGCHAGPMPSSELDLTANAGLVGRLKDVSAKHGDINCASDPADFMACVPAGCPDAYLVDSNYPDDSWILQKINGTQGDCGAQMPDGLFDDDQKACVEKLVRAIAALP
jgi:hypothetical protein